MIIVRPAGERGHRNYGWLDTLHTFSFNDYHDPRYMSFRLLRVINEDRVAPGKGFPQHGHRDMEILSWVLEGALEHKDSLGNGSVIHPGELQRMSAGTGILHSEYNPSETEPVHFLQIWIHPARRGLQPEYEQKDFRPLRKSNSLCLLASPDGREGSLTIHQDVEVFAGSLESGQSLSKRLEEDRHAWVQVTGGSFTINGQNLEEGDGAAVSGETILEIQGREAAEFILFDLF